MPGALTCGPTLVNDSSKYLKQRGCAMDLVDYHELSDLGTQERIGILQAALIGRTFQIQVKGGGFSPSQCDSAGQGSLSHLPRSQ